MNQKLERLKNNPLVTKEDLQNLVLDMLEPIGGLLSKEKAWLNLGETATKYSHKTAWIEGFLRPLFGIVPLLAGGGSYPLWEEYLTGIKNGTNPKSHEYWGKIVSKDQRIVEMTTLGLALAIIPEKIWEPLSIEQKDNLEKWLNQINNCELATNNWLFFHVIVNMGLKKVGAQYNQEVMEEALFKIEKSYLSNGWYSDGPTEQRDYYVPFAMHFYGLIYAQIMDSEDAKRASIYRERARTFAKDFIYWFGKEGDALPFGRSLTYRFAMNAFWGALAFSGVEVFSWGVMKGIILRNIRWWMKQPIFDCRGILTIGYTYPNLKMAEFYNAPGSPNWAMKAFLPLALSDNHPFWSATEEDLPPLEEIKVQKHPHMIFMRDDKKAHIQALTSGQYAAFEPTHMAAKYEKFMYSNIFGFSVPAGEYGLSQGSYDSMLALSEGDELYRVRRKCECIEVSDRYIYSNWYPWKDVSIHTWLIPCNPWHIRIHRIISNRKLKTAEGGYSIRKDFYEETPSNYSIEAGDGYARAKYPWGISGIIDLIGSREGEVIDANPNTNLLHSRTQIPTLKQDINIGETWLACAVLGEPLGCNLEDDWNNRPDISFNNQDIIKVTYKGVETTYDLKSSTRGEMRK